MDTESIHSSDKLFVAGAVISNEESKGFALPLIRINTGEERIISGEHSLLFEGRSEHPGLSIALRATDIDQNDGWYENKDNLLKVAGDIGGGVAAVLSANPEVGATTTGGIKKGLGVLEEIVDFFVKNDKNDLLGNFGGIVEFNEDMPFNTPQTKPLILSFREHDDYVDLGWFGKVYVDYNDFSYEFTLRVDCKKYNPPIDVVLGHIRDHSLYHSNVVTESSPE